MSRRSPLAVQLEDYAWLRARRAEGWSVERLRAELRTSGAVVRTALAAAGLPAKLGGPQFPELYDRAWMRATLAEHSVTDVARMLGCSTRSARDAARRADIPGRRRTPRPTQLADRAWLEQQLLKGRSYEAIASELGCSSTAVGKAVGEHGLSYLGRRRRRFAQLYDEDWLRTALATNTPRQVAEEVGCSVESVRAAARLIHRR